MKIALFYGNSLSTQVLASRLSARLHAMGHQLVLVQSLRSLRGAFTEEQQWPEVYFQVFMLEEQVFPFLEQRTPPEGVHAWSPGHLPRQFDAPSQTVTSAQLNSPEMRDFLREHEVEGAISVRFPFIFKPPLIEFFQPRGFFWNLHSSHLPQYAGYSPFRWVLFHRESQTSFTLHEITPKIDSGRIIALWPQPIDPSMDLISAFMPLIPTTVDMTAEAVALFEAGTEIPPPPSLPGPPRYYSRLKPEDRDRMAATGVRFVDRERLKATYMESFSVPGTAHWEAFSALLDVELMGKVFE